jgi:TatD DNase family protein
VDFIDSHAHLADPAFDEDRDQVIARARQAGARAILAIGESIGAADRAVEISAAYPGFVHHTAGIHPHDAARFDAMRDPDSIRAHCAAGAVAVGECGLDYHYDNAPRDVQRAVFAAQIALADELGRPLVVHTRDAEADTRTMLSDAAAAGVRGVLHCYTGTMSLAEHALAAGWYLSFSGIITFGKWTADDVVRSVPDDRILVESDAPYLAPVPNRGRRNEPAFVASTVARAALVRGITAEELGALAADNARTLFALPEAVQ